MAYGQGSGNGGRSNYRDRDAPREFFKATCSDCGAECEVPFKPTQGRPVYCRDCFKKHSPPRDDTRRRY
jgi:CxxC-x17-CxxC domain-containing protein